MTALNSQLILVCQKVANSSDEKFKEQLLKKDEELRNDLTTKFESALLKKKGHQKLVLWNGRNDQTVNISGIYTLF